MAVSGTITFRTNCQEIIKGALRIIGGYDFENTSGPTTAQLNLGMEALNILVKQWGAIGLQLWERRYAVVFPQKNQSVFALGSPGPSGDHATYTTPLGVAGFVKTTMDGTASSGDTTITVDDITSSGTVGVPSISISNGYYIGIQLADGTLQWTTVSGSPSGNTITLATALTDDVEDGAVVYSYQTKLIRPLRISDAFIRQVGNNDVPVQIIPREVYNRFGMKGVTLSSPSQLYYDNQENTGYIYLYPGFIQVTQLLYIEMQKPIDDFSSLTNDYDLPQEWGGVLKYGLAMALAPEYEISMNKFKQIQYLYDEAMTLVKNWDQEADSLYLSPNSTIINQSGSWR